MVKKIHASMRGQDSRIDYVSRVLVTKTISVPPLSVKYVEALSENPADVPLAIYPPNCKDIYIPSVLLNGSINAQLCLMNMTYFYVMFKRNTKFRYAMEMDIMVVQHEDPEGDEPSVLVRSGASDSFRDIEGVLNPD